MMHDNRKFLNKLFNEQGVDFHVAKQLGQKWELYTDAIIGFSSRFPINHREIFPDEVVLDFDTKSKDDRNKAYHLIVSRLKKHKFAFNAWSTGGKGVHIHLFFPELKKVPNEQRSIYKEEIIKYIAAQQINTAKIDFQLCGRHLVRSEFGTHEKTGKDKLPIEEYTPLIKQDNKIPDKVISAVKRRTLNSRHTQTRVAGKMAFPCVNYLVSQDFAGIKDGRARALFILASYAYNNLGMAKGLDLLNQWNDYKMNGYFKEQELKSKLMHIKRNKIQVGCRYIKYLLTELGITNKVCGTCLLEK